MTLNRREALTALTAGLFLAAAGPASSPSRLKELARARNILIGAAVDFRADSPDSTLLDLVARECDAVTPENGGKWKWIEPEPSHLRWGAADRAVTFARQNGMRINWHVLLWQNGGMPEFMKLPTAAHPISDARLDPYYSPAGTLSSANCWTRFTGFVDRIAERYGDIFYRIDVANELFLGDLTEDTVDPYGFRKGTWWHAAGGADGPQWVDRFFHYVRRAFPSAKLVVNEFGIEAESAQHRRKRAALLAWLKGAKARGCPVDGVGLQSHLMAAAPYDTPGMRAFCRDVKSLGLAVHITELDVNGLRLPTTLSRHERNRITAQYARHHVTVLADHADLAEITWWGLRSDLNHTAKRHRHERRLEPSPFDAESRPLPMYDAVCQALEDTA